jgi:K(+)-stimulated pyrophosphate-energized sodium pump
MNPVIKFTTLFGLLAVELAVEMNRSTSLVLAVVFFIVSAVFVWRSFYAMRIEGSAVSVQVPGGEVEPVPAEFQHR